MRALAVADSTDWRAEAFALQTLLQQKDVLLQEMQHRVANSLQIIASILLIKARAVDSEDTRLHLQQAHQRIMAVAAVHQQLQDCKSAATVGLRPYLTRLCETLAAAVIGESRAISVKLRLDDGVVSAGSAVSIGLIVTELVINAVKYAFPDDRSGATVIVTYDRVEPNWRLAVSDNGVGRSQLPSHDRTQGLGMTIVEALADQIEAHVDVETQRFGTTVSITHISPRTITTAS